jgi:type IV pilus assembly protein PilB
MDKQKELLQELLRNNLITREQFAQIEEDSANGKPVEDILVEKQIMDIEEIYKIKAKSFGIFYQNLVDKKITDVALNIIPIEAAENYKIICFELSPDKIKVGLVDPDNFKAISAIDFLAKEQGWKVEYYLVSPASFDSAFKQYKTLSKEIFSALKVKEEEESKDLIQLGDKKLEKVELEEIVKSAPVTKIVSVIIRHAVDGRASDIHIEPLLHESRVRYRIDGVLHTSLVLPRNIHSAIVARIKVMASLKLDETRIPQEGRIRLLIDNREIDFRISIIPLVAEEKVEMRILDITKGAPTLKDLGFVGAGLDTIEKNIKKTDGMFLITGPTGSGKSTTLFSIINSINKEGVNISTLEDPVEYYIQGVNQSQVRPELGFSFATGLKTLLRQDPNVIMVGEIRDNETAELAIHASLTGHFVFSTLHTNDALGSIARMIDMGVEPFLLGSTLNTLLAQRLVRKICKHCKVRTEVTVEIMEEVKKQLEEIPAETIKDRLKHFNKSKIIFHKGEGCPRCGKTGYNGRIAIVEIINVNNELKNMIMEHKKIITIDDIKRNQQFLTMKQDAILKVLSGMTTIEEVLRVAHE